MHPREWLVLSLCLGVSYQEEILAKLTGLWKGQPRAGILLGLLVFIMIPDY